MPESRLIKIYDTTLRDGTQGEGVAFSMEDKVRIAQRLDALGVHYIEGGWPGSNPKDLRFFKRVQDAVFKTAKTAASGPPGGPGYGPRRTATSRRWWRRVRRWSPSSARPGTSTSPPRSAPRWRRT